MEEPTSVLPDASPGIAPIARPLGTVEIPSVEAPGTVPGPSIEHLLPADGLPSATAGEPGLIQQWLGFDPSLLTPNSYWYVVLILLLFILPQVFTRFRIPSAITTLGLGALSGMFLGLFRHDSTIELLSLFGISALFLFAGMEVDFRELRTHARVLIAHLLVCLSALALVAVGLGYSFSLGPQPALLIALALLTPSTGFILSSLRSFGLDEGEASQVKINAIASEILALVVLFFCVQSGSWRQLAFSMGAIVGLIVALPIALWFFARHIVKHAPRSEFAFVMILAILCSLATRQLGAYYLLGAFITGVVAVRTKRLLPELASQDVIHSIELFSSFFIPFYFFHAGLALKLEYFSLQGVMWGLIFLAILLPFRLAYVVGHRLPITREAFHVSRRIAVTLLPTLVFTLVLASLLREQYPEVIAERPWIFGGLIIYTLVNTLIPGLFLGSSPEQLEFANPQLSQQFSNGNPVRPARRVGTLSLPSVALEPKMPEPKGSSAPPASPPASPGEPLVRPPPSAFEPTPPPGDLPSA